MESVITSRIIATCISYTDNAKQTKIRKFVLKIISYSIFKIIRDNIKYTGKLKLTTY